MPELPEVEAARRAIEEHCVGKKIVKSVVANDSKVIDGVSPKDFEASLTGKTIVASHRKGKNMWLQLDSPPFPSFQFGMTGAIYIKGIAVTKYKRSAVKDTDEWPSKYSKLFIELDDGLEFSFTDKRRFAKVRLLDNPVSVPPISELGPDALLEPMTVDEFYNSLSKKKIGIKALLLDQSFISGIGNWMADEVLYQARIHPLETASSLSKESCVTLLKCINEVTKFAVKVDADCSRFPVEWMFHFRWGKRPGKVNEAVEVGADSSQFPSNWIFHSREKKPGKAFVDGKKIEFITAGGRTSAYVPELQKLSGNQARKVVVESSNNIEESSNEEATDSRKSKVPRGRKATVKKPSSKRKSKESNGESNSDDDDDKSLRKEPPSRGKSKGRNENDDQKKKSKGKKTPTKRIFEESDDEDDVDNASGSGDDDEEDHKVMSKKRGKAGSLSKGKVGSGRNGRQQKRVAK
ncbi:formamidopyrimidine-DNA glycosylase isoform X3 [Olea europaea var. sylvestris]|uniref:formamidopyrimidine-DNA glycosylase isoform X3 n=1 Tax=Olea europaea var. sylvestris TaxID=158386 RepID=UPI000C1D6213|nr:formamidopyrimidine-DNA glycosylase isoform X3 [Olea europaea var. sylvestris]